ncbi:MAG: hypothetical protein M3008_01610 [Chloroflexota bacterium]|nr:hypothetical protein [Chloroflexota bacterium]
MSSIQPADRDDDTALDPKQEGNSPASGGNAGDALCFSWAEIRYGCERERRPISVADAWATACALRFDAPLVTHNRKDFEVLSDLQIISEND